MKSPRVFQVVLVPLDHGAPGHRRVLDRHQVVHRLVTEKESARVDREVPREVLDLPAQADKVIVQRSGRVEAGLRELRRIERTVVREELRETVERGLGQTERLADLTHRGAGAIAHDVRHHRGAVAAVPGVDVLDHLLAPHVHDVEVDVGRLVALARQEPLEQQLDLCGVDRRDPEAVADHRVRGRAAALAEDPLAPAEADNLPHGQEVAAVVELVDERELPVDLREDGRWRAAGETPARPAKRELAEPCGRGLAVGQPLGRIAVADLGQGEGAAQRHLAGARKQRRLVGEQPRHRLRRLQIVLGVRLGQPSGGGQRHAVADAGEDILKRAARRRVVEHLGGGDQGKTGALGMAAHARLLANLLGAAMSDHHRVEPVAERLAHRCDDRAGRLVPDQQASVAAPERDEPLGPRAELRPGHARRPFRPPQPAAGDEAAEVGVAGAVRREQHTGGGGRRGVRGALGRRAAGGAGAVLGADRHLRAEDQREAELARPHMRAHRAMDAIAVGEGERRQPEGVCLLDELVGATRPFEKREVTLAPQRDVGHRALFPLSATAPPPAMRGAAAPDAPAGRHPPPVRVVHAQPLSHHLEGHAARRARGRPLRDVFTPSAPEGERIMPDICL